MSGEVHKTAEAFSYIGEIRDGREPYFGLELWFLTSFQAVSYTHLPEETKARLDAWMRGSKEVLRQWITEKRYRELISCAHGGWYQDDVIFEPLAEHFVAHHLFDELRFLCERGIRFSVEDMLLSLIHISSRARKFPLSARWAIPILPGMRNGSMPTANSFPKQS